jgi:hypothetical protein
VEENWLRVSRGNPCKICKRPNHEHQSSWCIMTRDGELAICQFVAEGSIKQVPNTGGFLHRLKERNPDRMYRELERQRTKPKPPQSTIDWEKMIDALCLAVPNGELNRLAEGLGVTADSLNLLDIGYMGGGKWSFPMFNDQREPTGIRTRTNTGEKRAVTGSKEGVFIPFRRRDGLLVFCEGPTDTAAILDLGFDCIGRPSCHGGTAYGMVLARRRKVAVLADNDKSSIGTQGATKFAMELKNVAAQVKILHPGYRKDAREFVRNGGKRDSILTMYACVNEL